MPSGVNEAEVSALDLSRPSETLAAHVTRELGWDERIEGAVFDPGPGLVVQRVYRLGHLSSLMDAVPNFTVDLTTLRTWLRDTVGDPELSNAVGAVLTATQGDDDHPAGPREGVCALLRLRHRQCEEVLAGAAEEETSAAGDE
jgi:hypothetical protein